VTTRHFTDIFKNEFHIEPERTALVVIDMQNASASRTEGVGKLLTMREQTALGDWRFTRIEKVVLPNLLRLLAFFRNQGLKIVHVAWGSAREDYSDMPMTLRPLAMAVGNRAGEPANEFLRETTPWDGECVIRKRTQSAFMSSSIDQELRALNVQCLLFGGVSTNVCVDGTARDAADLGYNCIILEDACAGVSEELHRAALQSFACQSGLVKTTAEVIREIEEKLEVSPK